MRVMHLSFFPNHVVARFYYKRKTNEVQSILDKRLTKVATSLVINFFIPQKSFATRPLAENKSTHNADSIIESKVIYYFEQCGLRV